MITHDATDSVKPVVTPAHETSTALFHDSFPPPPQAGHPAESTAKAATPGAHPAESPAKPAAPVAHPAESPAKPAAPVAHPAESPAKAATPGAHTAESPAKAAAPEAHPTESPAKAIAPGMHPAESPAKAAPTGDHPTESEPKTVTPSDSTSRAGLEKADRQGDDSIGRGSTDGRKFDGRGATDRDAAGNAALGLPNLTITNDNPTPAAPDTPAAASGDGGQQALIQAAQKTLGDANASAADKLGTVAALADDGIKNIQVPDNNGQMRDYSVQTEKAGDRTMVHLYGKDDQGKDQIVLRGIENSNGSFSKENDSRGHNVSYEGSNWAKAEQNKTAVGITSDTQSGSPAPTPNPGEQPQPSTDTTVTPPDKQVQPPDGSTKPTDGSVPPADKTQAKPVTEPSSGDILHTYEAKATGYQPVHSQGGKNDRLGNPIHTLQDYLAGKAPYVSVAMDSHAGIPYGQKVNIPELNQKYGQTIPFEVVDTGSAFQGKGHSRLDIAVNTSQEAHDDSINGRLTLQFMG